MRARIFDIPVNSRSRRIILIDEPEQISLDDFVDQIYHHGDQRTLDAGDALLIRLPPDRNGPADVSRYQADSLLRRVPNKPIHLLYSSDYKYYLSRPLNPHQDLFRSVGNEEVHQRFLSELRNTELRSIVLETHALLPPGENFYYRLPSGAAARMFLRVGNVQTSREIIDIFFFWILRYLRDCEGIITDTWSISSIALNVSRLLARYDPENFRQCRVEMVSQYQSDDATQADILQRVDRIWPRAGKKLVVLFSAQMTGKLENQFRFIFRNNYYDLDKINFVTLYRLTDKIKCNALCDLSDGFGDHRFDVLDEDELREAGTVAIHVDPQTYFPLRFEEVPIRVRKNITDDALPFFERYGGKNIVKVHHDPRGGDYPPRHRGIFLDIEAMIQLPEFKTQFEEKLLKIIDVDGPPSLIVAPPHSAGNMLRKLAEDIINAKYATVPSSFAHRSLYLDPVAPTPADNLLREVFGGLGPGDSLLILDDTCQTGNRLERYQQNLWDIFHGRVHYLVGVARPDDLAVWSRLVRMLEYREPDAKHTVEFVEFLLLPQWVDECPWCKELEYLESRIGEMSGSSIPRIILDRVELLRGGKVDGMNDDLFIRLDSDLEMTIGEHSLFLREPCSEADILAAVASAIQRLRTRGESDAQALTPWRHPIAPVLDSVEYLQKVFKSSVLRAAFFRSAYHHEVNHVRSDFEEKRREYIREIMFDPDPNRTNLTLEMFYNSAIGKLPDFDLDEDEAEKLSARGHLACARFYGLG